MKTLTHPAEIIQICGTIDMPIRHNAPTRTGVYFNILIVLHNVIADYKPHCHVVRIKDDWFIRCNVSYTGNLIPTLQCSDVVRNDSLSVQITSKTDVDSCMLCFQTQGGKCVNRTVVVDDPPITGE